MMLRLPALAIPCLLLFNLSVLAQDLPGPTDGHVLDLADVLDATAEARIERLLGETEQSTGVAQVSLAVTELDQGTQQNAALVEQTAAAAAGLAESAQQLANEVSFFKLK